MKLGDLMYVLRHAEHYFDRYDRDTSFLKYQLSEAYQKRGSRACGEIEALHNKLEQQEIEKQVMARQYDTDPKKLSMFCRSLNKTIMDIVRSGSTEVALSFIVNKFLRRF